MDYFYDNQIRRYLLQFIRIFSDMKIQSGEDENGLVTQSRVPVRYAALSRMVGWILNDGNTAPILPTPMMTVWIQSLEMAPKRRNDPMFVGKVHHTERNFDVENEEYGTESGTKYSVERYMPVPYDLTLQLDIWTTTTTSKLQLIEQITSIFNPTVQLQQNSNMIDWSSVFEVELTEVTFSNRTLGSDAERDVATLVFKLPIWINPPAKVKTQKLIHQIVTNVFESDINSSDLDSLDPLTCDYDELAQIIITPNNHMISLGVDSAPNELLLLNAHGYADPSFSWKTLLEAYGEVEDGISTITIKTDADIESDEGDIIGTFTLDPDRPNVVIWNPDIDTFPSNTLPAFDKVINPRLVSPGEGLPNAAVGQRYLVLGDGTEDSSMPLVSHSHGWDTVAYENDIIQYSNGEWSTVFSSANSTNTEFATNTSISQQYKYIDGEWQYTFLGKYRPGYWRIRLQ